MRNVRVVTCGVVSFHMGWNDGFMRVRKDIWISGLNTFVCFKIKYLEIDYGEIDTIAQWN